MQQQNIKEYTFVREELQSLKNCITTYMGFVLSGSGIAFIGIAAVTKSSGSNEIIGYTCFLLSIIITMVLLILMYKFNSHNRFAGYSKLLNQEKFSYPKGIKIDDQFISWELCMDILRETEHNPDLSLNKCKKVKIPDIPWETIYNNVKKTSGIPPEVDQGKYFEGFLIMVNSMFGKTESSSWHFPVYIVSIFFALVLIFLLIGSYFIIQAVGLNIISISSKYPSLILPAVVIIIQFFVWKIYCKKLYALMEGSTQVEAYCWKFLPIRYDYIKNQNEEIIYDLITLK